MTRGSAIVAYKLIAPADVEGVSEFLVDFGDLAKLEQNDALQLHLQAGSGWEIQGKNFDPNYKVICDLRRERGRSQFITQRPPSVAATNLIRPWQLLTPVAQADGSIRIKARGSIISSFALQSSTNLMDWRTIATLDSDTFEYSEPATSNPPVRLYRVWLP